MATRKSKTPQSPTLKADKKRIEILKAAGKCFRKTGFHQTSMQEICAETGLGPGAVYRYFTGKDAIIEAMADDERRQARGILTQLQAAENLPDGLAAVTQAFSTRYSALSDAGLMTEVYAEGMRNKRVGNVIRKAESEWVAGLTELLLTSQARGQIDAAQDARQTALFLTAMWDGMVIRQAYHTEDKTSLLPATFTTMLRRVLAREGKAEKRVKAVPVAASMLTPLLGGEPQTSNDPDLRQLTLI